MHTTSYYGNNSKYVKEMDDSFNDYLNDISYCNEPAKNDSENVVVGSENE